MKNRNQIIEENLGLVHSCCKKFRGKGIDYEDLYMAGCTGLINAVDRFDESLGYKLSTYAVPVILGEIRRLFREGGSLKVSRSIKELYLKITNLTDRDSELTVSQLAQRLGTTEEKIAEALSAGKIPLSLTSEDNGEIDLTVSSCEEDYTEKLSLKEALKELDTQDSRLIDLRYYKHMTQTEAGKYLNMTQVQVSRREKKILHSIRKKMLC